MADAYHDGLSADDPEPDIHGPDVNEDAMPAETCVWTEDMDGYWDTACGHDSGCDGLPSGNGMRFCCYCGKPLEEMPRIEAMDDDEEESDGTT